MAQYNKFWVALAGALLIGLDQFFGISFGYAPEALVTTVIAVLTALGVLKTANK